MRIELGFPGRLAEKEMLTGRDRRELIRDLKPMIAIEQLVGWQDKVRQVHVADSVREYVLDLLEKSRQLDGLGTGLSPRAGLALQRCSQAWAFIAGREMVIPEDVQAVAPSGDGAPARLLRQRRGAQRARADRTDRPRRGRAMTPRLRFTALWFLFGPVLGCMWMAAVNYTNNLVYAVLYLIGALTFISIFHTWRNLASIEIEHVRVRPAFAGEEIEVEFHLRNRGRRPSFNLVFQRLDRGAVQMMRSRKGAGVDAGDSRVLEAFLPPQKRGAYRLGRIAVRSAYPFGLFWAVRRMTVEAAYFVYPEPRGNAVLPDMIATGSEGPPLRSGDDFSGVRAYSPGESLRHIDWKAYARGRPLMVKQFTGGLGRELWLESRLLPGLTLEDRLSQLTLWALEAEEGEVPYGLSVGQVNLPPALGTEHQRRVLEALAVGGEETSREQ